VLFADDNNALSESGKLRRAFVAAAAVNHRNEIAASSVEASSHCGDSLLLSPQSSPQRAALTQYAAIEHRPVCCK